MNISETRAILDTVHRGITRGPVSPELSGAVAKAAAIARREERQSLCSHEATVDRPETNSGGRRILTICVDCAHILKIEEAA